MLTLLTAHLGPLQLLPSLALRGVEAALSARRRENLG